MADPQVDGIINVMIECAEKLPPQWEDDFWLESARDLASVILERRSVLSEMNQGVLIGIGGMLLRQLQKENEALSLTEQMFGRVREARNG